MDKLIHSLERRRLTEMTLLAVCAGSALLALASRSAIRWR
jgi:hypothetical protein